MRANQVSWCANFSTSLRRCRQEQHLGRKRPKTCEGVEIGSRGAGYAGCVLLCFVSIAFLRYVGLISRINYSLYWLFAPQARAKGIHGSPPPARGPERRRRQPRSRRFCDVPLRLLSPLRGPAAACATVVELTCSRRAVFELRSPGFWFDAPLFWRFLDNRRTSRASGAHLELIGPKASLNLAHGLSAPTSDLL